jgi:hypothetical protein
MMGAGNSERADAAQRAAETRRRLLKAGQNAAASGSSDEESVMIGQWSVSRHSDELPARASHDTAEDDDPDFAA